MDKIKRISVLVVLTAGIALFCSSCRYEEGPFINFVRVDNRIRGEWEISKIIRDDGTSVSSTSAAEESVGAIMDFYRTHIFIMHCKDNTTIYNCEGSWDFGEKKRSVIVNFRGLRQVISREYEIVKFKNDELKLRYTDDNGVTWTITLDLLLSYIEYGY